jgi:hypothetical protein
VSMSPPNPNRSTNRAKSVMFFFIRYLS